MAIDRNQVLLESGETHTLDDLPLLIRTNPSSIVVAHHFGNILRYLDSQFEANPLWQYRVTPIERTSWSPERKRQAVMKDCIVNYFGFKGERKQAGLFHYPLSPHIYCLRSVSELRKGIPGEDVTIVKLMEWAKEVRDFLQRHKLGLSPTSGGIATQLLKDSKFYPSARRKVPKHTNARVRDQLPGNYYKLYGAKKRFGLLNATYLDQISAHHSVAAEIELPNANSLQRHGRYSTLTDKPFARYGTEKYDRFIKQYGLFYLAVEKPRLFEKDFPLPCVDNGQGYGRIFVYSNELPYLEKLKIRIRHIIACWTSPDVDTGIKAYAEWALDEVQSAPENSKPWLKPTLLSTYGVLAAKPRQLECGYKQAKNSEPKRYPCGSGFLEVQARRQSKETEPLTANVIHRGMIEAQTRLRSLEYAKELAGYGLNVLAIYADSVFVESDKPLPFIDPRWRIQSHLTNLHFQSATHFTSREITKTPGVPISARAAKRLPPRPNKRKVTVGNVRMQPA